MFRLHSHLTAVLNGRNITGKLVGIDSYTLNNFKGGNTGWTSYTLVSDQKGRLSRYWIIDRGKVGWFISLAAKKKKLTKKHPIVLERSGLAHIAFKGDQGVSTPAAALLSHKLKRDQYYTIECFRGEEVMFFLTQKIRKPKERK